MNQTFQRISKDKNVVVVSVEIRDENQEENMATKIQLDKESSVGCVFDYLYRKNKKYNSREYVAKVKFQNDEDYVELDQKMPITLLQQKTIIVSITPPIFH